MWPVPAARAGAARVDAARAAKFEFGVPRVPQKICKKIQNFLKGQLALAKKPFVDSSWALTLVHHCHIGQHWLHVAQPKCGFATQFFPKKTQQFQGKFQKFAKGQLAPSKKPFVNSSPLTLVLYCYISRRIHRMYRDGRHPCCPAASADSAA